MSVLTDEEYIRRLKQRAKNYDIINEETWEHYKDQPVPPEPLQYRRADDLMSDVSFQRDKAFNTLKKILLPTDLGAVLNELQQNDELSNFNQYAPRFIRSLKGRKQMSPTNFMNIWEKFKDELENKVYEAIGPEESKSQVDNKKEKLVQKEVEYQTLLKIYERLKTNLDKNIKNFEKKRASAPQIYGPMLSATRELKKRLEKVKKSNFELIRESINEYAGALRDRLFGSSREERDAESILDSTIEEMTNLITDTQSDLYELKEELSSELIERDSGLLKDMLKESKEIRKILNEGLKNSKSISDVIVKDYKGLERVPINEAISKLAIKKEKELLKKYDTITRTEILNKLKERENALFNLGLDEKEVELQLEVLGNQLEDKALNEIKDELEMFIEELEKKYIGAKDERREMREEKEIVRELDPEIKEIITDTNRRLKDLEKYMESGYQPKDKPVYRRPPEIVYEGAEEKEYSPEAPVLPRKAIDNHKKYFEEDISLDTLKGYLNDFNFLQKLAEEIVKPYVKGEPPEEVESATKRQFEKLIEDGKAILEIKEKEQKQAEKRGMFQSELFGALAKRKKIVDKPLDQPKAEPAEEFESPPKYQDVVNIMAKLETEIKEKERIEEEKGVSLGPQEYYRFLKSKKSHEIMPLFWGVLTEEEKAGNTFDDIIPKWGKQIGRGKPMGIIITQHYRVRGDDEIQERQIDLETGKSKNRKLVFLAPKKLGQIKEIVYRKFGDYIVGKGLLDIEMAPDKFVSDVLTLGPDNQETIRTPRENNYSKFGKYVIHLPSLSDGYINLKYKKSFGHIKRFPKKMISSKIKQLIKHILAEGQFPEDLYLSLSKKDKAQFDEIVDFSRLDNEEAVNFLKYRSQKSKDRDKDIERFDLLRGSLMAGNNSDEILRELKVLLHKMKKDKTISQTDFNELIYIMSMM